MSVASGRVGSPAVIRPFQAEDAEGAATLLRQLVPEFVVTAELLSHWLAAVPSRARGAHWVAERDGDIVGWSDAEFRLSARDEGIGLAWVAVREDVRGRGVGGRLYELAERHLLERGAWKLQSWTRADDPSRGFAERRGYVQTRIERLSTLDVPGADLSELPALEAASGRDGFRVVRLRELRNRPRELHALYDETAADMPGDDERRPIDFDEWIGITWGNPLLDFDLSSVVVEGERPVAFAWLLVDREGRRADHELTGTLRSHRGRSLARLAKLAAVRWSREAGIDTLLTGNDSTNAPMLAINDRLGYRPTILHPEVAKTVGERPQSSDA